MEIQHNSRQTHRLDLNDALINEASQLGLRVNKDHSFDLKAIELMDKIRPALFENVEDHEQMRIIVIRQPLLELSRAILMVLQMCEIKSNIFIDRLREEKEEIESIKADLDIHCRDLEGTNQLLQKNNQKLVQQYLKLQQEMADLYDKVGVNSHEHHHNQALMLDLRKDNEKLHRQIQQLKQKYQELNREYEQLKTDSEGLEEANAKLRQQIQVFVIDKKMAGEQSRLTEEHIQTLENKITQLTKKNQEYIEKVQIYYNCLQHPESNLFSSPGFQSNPMTTDRKSIRQFEKHSNELKGLQFNFPVSVERGSKQSSKYTIQDKIFIMDHERSPQQSEENEPSRMKENSMINSVPIPAVEMSAPKSNSKTKSIGKYTAVKKKDYELCSKYLTHGKVHAFVPMFEASSRKKCPGLRSQKSNRSSELMERLLNDKLSQKSMKIHSLEKQIELLRGLCLEQKANMTDIEGEYELQVQDLTDRLAYAKQELRQIHEQNIKSRTLCSTYQQQISELEDELEKVHKEYDIYCNMVKMKCKGYIFRLIETLEYEYKEILMAMVEQSQLEEREQSRENISRQKEQILNFQEVQQEKQRKTVCQMGQNTEVNKYMAIEEVYGITIDNRLKFINLCPSFDIAKQLPTKMSKLTLTTFSFVNEVYHKQSFMQICTLPYLSIHPKINSEMSTQTELTADLSHLSSPNKSISNDARFLEKIAIELRYLRDNCKVVLPPESAIFLSNYEANLELSSTAEQKQQAFVTPFIENASEQRSENICHLSQAEDIFQDCLEEKNQFSEDLQEVEGTQFSFSRSQNVNNSHRQQTFKTNLLRHTHDDQEDITILFSQMNLSNNSPPKNENLDFSKQEIESKDQPSKKDLCTERQPYFLVDRQEDAESIVQREISQSKQLWRWDGSEPFVKPKFIRNQKIFILAQNSSKEQEWFILTEHFIQNVRNRSKIEFMGHECISDELNFMFGQAEVRITYSGLLEFCRRSKNCRLQGNIEDGCWQILKMQVCESRR